MLTYLLDKLDKIKKERALYCSQIEETKKENEKEKKTITAYDFICKNTRKN
jgi:hypothetical protein